MRMRIISAAVILGLGVVGIAVAQQDGDRQKPQAPDKTTLRAQVARLRAEVELLELEHEADKTALITMLKELRNFEAEPKRVAVARQTVDEASMVAARIGKLEEFKKEFGDEKAMQVQVEKELKENAESMRAEADRAKQAFVKRATDLAERRLELAEVEARYNQAK